MRNKGMTIFGIFCILSVIGISAAMFIGIFPMLSIILAAFACFFALFILIELLWKKALNPWFAVSYILVYASIIAFYTVYGVDGRMENLLGNLLIALPAVAVFLVLVFFALLVRRHWRNAACAVICTVMIGASVFYVLTMNLRIKPQVEPLQDGHELYLSSLNGTDISDSPNVLFILADDMGYADISSYSYKQDGQPVINTPNIDSIGENGVMLENFYAASPVCTPSRFACMTGRYPSRGYLDNVLFPTEAGFTPFSSTRYYNPFQFVKGVDGILPDEITVAEALQSAGYSTGMFGKWHLGDYGDYWPTKNGFDYFYGSPHVNDMTPYEYYRNEEKIISHKDMDQSKTTALLTEEITGFIENAVNGGDKFFAYYATPWPHYPIYASEEYEGTSKGGTYGDCLEELDASVGTVLDLLKSLDVFDDTLIIFTSDNGPGREGATGALRGRKNTTFDGGQKVPFLACYPGGFGKIDDRLSARTMNIDLFPTILDAVGIKLPNDRVIDGRSLMPLLMGDIAPDAKIHDCLYYIKGGKVQAVQMPVATDSGTHDFKFYKSVRTENSAFIDQVYKNYLFNLDQDPAEAYNVASTYPTAKTALEEQLKAFQKELKENRRGIL